jgi:hypothetical protein
MTDQLLENLIKHLDKREAALFSHYGPFTKGTQRSVDFHTAEALKAAVAALSQQGKLKTSMDV